MEHNHSYTTYLTAIKPSMCGLNPVGPLLGIGGSVFI